MTSSDDERAYGRPQDFATTHWSVVLAARRCSSPEASAALENLCHSYMNTGMVKVAVHRLRKRYRELLLHEVSQTVTVAGEIDDEVRELFKALSR